MYTFREKVILNELYKSRGYTTVSDLAEKCNVTSRTVINDLDDIKSTLSKSNIKLITKPRVGVIIQVPDDEKDTFEKEINISKGIINPVSPEERVMYIVKTLIESDGLVTCDEIARKLYVSKSTVTKDFEKVEKHLKKYGASLYKKQKHGTRIIADEKTIRIIKADTLKKLMSMHQYTIDYGFENIMESADIDKIKNVLINIEYEFDYLLSDISFKGLMIHIAISVKRIKQGNVITIDEDEIKLLKSQNEWKIAAAISKKISEIFNVNLNESEIGYITIHLAGAKLQNDMEAEKISLEHLHKLDSTLFERISSILKSLAKKTGFDFDKDEKLFAALFLHLRPAINRAKNSINLSNPLLGDIKKEYGMAYEIAVILYENIKKLYGISMMDDEIGYVALHFAASIERFKKPKKLTAVLICATGMGTSQLLFTKFSRVFPEIEVIDILSAVNAYKEIDKISPDIILSTVPFKSYTSRVVNVSPLFSENDIENIRKAISEKPVLKIGKGHEGNTLRKFIDKDCVSLGIKAKTREDVIKLLADKLAKKKYVKHGFYESVLKREKLSSTYIGNRIAMPHAYEGFVNKCSIEAAVLKSSVRWGENKVQLVFMMAVDMSTKKEFGEIFGRLSDVANDKNIIDRLLACKTNEEFLDILISMPANQTT